VLSGGAIARVTNSDLETLIIADSIPSTETMRMSEKVEQLTVAPLIGEAIKRIAEERSISELFK
jgi:ribose-phosphate pyrophosphokinase